MGIEPTQPAWKAGALPLSYTRASHRTAWHTPFTARESELRILGAAKDLSTDAKAGDSGIFEGADRVSRGPRSRRATGVSHAPRESA